MTSYVGELDETTRLSPSMSDMDETVLFPLTPDAENRRQRLQPPVTPPRTDPGGGDGGASDADITLTQAASRLIDSASKIASLTRRAELRTSTPKRKRGAEGDGDAGGPASSSSDDRPDWQEKSTVKAKRYRKRDIRNQRRKLVKDMTQLLSVMAKEEEQLSSSSDEQPDWIDSPLERRRQPFKIGRQQSKDKKPAQPAVTVKPKASENSQKTPAHNHVPEFENYFADDLLLNATPGTISHEGTDAVEDKGETVKKASSPKTAHETTLSEDEAIQQMLNAATLEDDVLCPATCSSQTQRSVRSVSSIPDQRLKSVTVVDETFSSGDDIAQELMNVARIHEAVEGSDISSPRKELRQTPSDATTDAELLSHLLEHDVTLSEEEAIYELLDRTVVEGEDQERDLGEELVKKTVEGVQSTEKAESSRSDNTAAECQKPGSAEGCAKACNDLRIEAVSRTDVSSPSLLANWGRVAPTSGLQLNHSHGNQLDVNNSKFCNTNSEILVVKQGRHEEQKEAHMPSSHPENAPSPSLLEYCEEEPAAREEQGVDNHGHAEQYTDETVFMEPTSTTSMLKNDDVNTSPKSVDTTAMSVSSSSDDDLRVNTSRVKSNKPVQPFLENTSPHPDVSSLGNVNPLENSATKTDPIGCAEVQERIISRPETVPHNDFGKESTVDGMVTLPEDKPVASPYFDGQMKHTKTDSTYFDGQRKHSKTDSPFVDRQKKSKDEKRRKSQTTLSQWFKDAGSSKQPVKTEEHSKPAEVVELSSSEDETFQPGPSSINKDSPEPSQFDVPLDKRVLQDDDKPSDQNKNVPEARVETQLQFWFGGVKVFFPCNPYKPQRAIMSTVAQSCRLGQFALLESPTGTGKTLALLCAALAWQTAEKAAIAQRLRAELDALDRQEELRWQAAAAAAAGNQDSHGDVYQRHRRDKAVPTAPAAGDTAMSPATGPRGTHWNASTAPATAPALAPGDVPQNTTSTSAEGSPYCDPEDKLVKLLNMMYEQDNDLLLKAYEDAQPVLDSQSYDECSSMSPAQQQNETSPQPEVSQYWLPSYEPSQAIPRSLQGEDTVDEKLQVTSAPQMLFTTTYNVTTSGSKRLNIGIETPIAEEWRVVLELENVTKNIKMRFDDDSLDYLCRAELYIQNHMTEKYYESFYIHPPDIDCGCIKASIETAYNDVALCLKSNGSTIYLQYSSVSNLYGMMDAVNCTITRLEKQLRYVKSRYREISEYLRVHNIHLDDLHKYLRNIPSQPSCGSLTAIETDSEFLAYKKTLFSTLCKGVKMLHTEEERFFGIDPNMHPDWDI